jgi:type II secretory pathway pseudopilin PulG
MLPPSGPGPSSPRRSGLTVLELVVVLLVLTVLASLAFLLFGRVRGNAVREACRTGAEAMARNARMIAADDPGVSAGHLAVSYDESGFPAGSSWDSSSMVLLYATPDGDCRVQFALSGGDVEVGDPEVEDVSFSDPSDPSTPSSPVDVVAVPGDRSVTLTWSAPTDESVTGHQVETCAVGGSCEVSIGGGSSAVVGDLSNGGSYTFRVAAVNDNGVGQYSPSTPVVVPRTVPGPPSKPEVVVDGTTVEVSVPPGADNGAPIIDHEVTCISPDGGETVSVTGPADGSPITVDGLTPPPDASTPVTYTCSAHSRNEAGDSAESPPSDSFETTGVPSPPLAVAVVAVGDASVELSWSPPAFDGGSPVTGYLVEQDDGTVWMAVGNLGSLSTSFVADDLENGTSYRFRVTAENAVGWGAVSADVSATPYGFPEPPTSLLAAPGTGADYGKVTLSWSAPSADGGSPVTSYTVEIATNPDFSGATSSPGASSPWTITGLTANTTYHLRVRAVTGYGTGPWSSTSALTVPSAPTVSLTCPQGYTSAGAQVNTLTSTCTVLTSTVSGATIDGLVAGPSGYSRTFTTAAYSAPDVPLANLYDGQMMANARLCNASGCGPYAAYLGVSASSVPQPGTPIVTKGDCAFGYCFVYFSATHAWTYEVNLYGGPSTGVLRCYNVACADGAGSWPVNFDGTNYYTERTNPGSGTRTLHVTDTCGGLGGCARSMLVPQGTWIRVSGTNGFAAGAPSGWPNSGWCVPAGGEPLAASCNWSTGPGSAESRSGYVLIG